MKQTPYLLFFFVFIFLFSNAQEINWLTIEEAEEANKKEPKKILIDVYTDWCGWCKKMDKTTFMNKDLVEYLNQKFYCVKLDGEDKGTLTFKGVEFNYIKQGRRGYNELAAGFLQGKMSYPSLVFLDENLVILQAIKGFQTAEELLPIAAFLGENIYLETDWMDYINKTKGK